MKKIFLQTMVIFSVLFLASTGWALLLTDSTDVGAWDTFHSGTSDLLDKGSGEDTELDWVRDVTGDSTITYTQYDTNLEGKIYNVNGYSEGYAFELNSESDYFLIKWGDGGKTDDDESEYVKWTLWNNYASKNWAVINLTDSGLADDGWEIKNIGSFSHYGETGTATAPVPEPSTILLASVGLSGLLFAGRKKRKSLK